MNFSLGSNLFCPVSIAFGWQAKCPIIQMRQEIVFYKLTGSHVVKIPGLFWCGLVTKAELEDAHYCVCVF